MRYTNTIRAIAIGSFDGVHIAHQRLIAQVDAVVIIERNSGELTAGYRRANHVTKPCYFYHLDRVKGVTPQAFVSRLMVDFPQLERIVVGYDFAFGRAKSADVRELDRIFEGEVVVIEEVRVEGISVHSRTIKEALRTGAIAKANQLLGRAYAIDGAVITGQGIGAKSLLPTLNLSPSGYLLPLSGVYATRTKVAGVWYDSVSFLGHRVTTDGTYAVESHILGVELGVVLGQVVIAFVAYLRANQKFESLEALKTQIVTDCATATLRLQERSTPHQ